MRPAQGSHNKSTSLFEALSAVDKHSDPLIVDANASITLSNLVSGSALFGRGDELCGRSVLVATTNQFTTASALIELDGVARRIVLCPPDLPIEHLPYVMDTAAVDGIVSDRTALQYGSPRPLYFSPCSPTVEPAKCERNACYKTEWILLTSGTTGIPKLVVHSLASLAGAIGPPNMSPEPIVWSTFYDIRRYGGLQIFIRAIFAGASLVLSNAQESPAAFLTRAARLGVTHISGTPSQWRRALMSPAACFISPKYIRLSGEIVDQPILNSLHSAYPHAQISHAFASTEAGVAFEVNDGFAGIPPETIMCTPFVEMKVKDNSLRIRSARTASRYLGNNVSALLDEEGFVDTGDLLELREGRYHFIGRRDGVINVGGLKVHPEEIEAVINRHPAVQGSIVRTKKNPMTGAMVIADVVLDRVNACLDEYVRELREDILLRCRESLSSYKVPAAINFISSLSIAESGKVLRRNA